MKITPFLFNYLNHQAPGSEPPAGDPPHPRSCAVTGLLSFEHFHMIRWAWTPRCYSSAWKQKQWKPRVVQEELDFFWFKLMEFKGILLYSQGFPCGSAGLWVGKIPWRREGLPTPVFWPGEFHGLDSPWGCKGSDMTNFHFPFHYIPVTPVGML